MKRNPMFRSHFETKTTDWIPLMVTFFGAVGIATTVIVYIST